MVKLAGIITKKQCAFMSSWFMMEIGEQIPQLIFVIQDLQSYIMWGRSQNSNSAQKIRK